MGITKHCCFSFIDNEPRALEYLMKDGKILNDDFFDRIFPITRITDKFIAIAFENKKCFIIDGDGIKKTKDFSFIIDRDDKNLDCIDMEKKECHIFKIDTMETELMDNINFDSYIESL